MPFFFEGEVLPALEVPLEDVVIVLLEAADDEEEEEELVPLLEVNSDVSLLAGWPIYFAISLFGTLNNNALPMP